MGMPIQLDGLPDKLNLRKPVRCPCCRRQIEYFYKEKNEAGEDIFVCSSCKNEVPRGFNAIIEKNIEK